MLKFLRKYNKVLLVGFGVFLMAAFLVPQALQELGRAGLATTVMRVNGRKISMQDQIDAQRQLMAVRGMTGSRELVSLGLDDKNADHWIMSREAARAAGLVGGAGDARLVLDQTAAQATAEFLRSSPEYMQGTPEKQRQLEQQTLEQVKQSLEQARTRGAGAEASSAVVDAGLASLLAIRRLLISYEMAPRASGPRAIREARRLFDEAQIHAVFLDVNNKLSTDLPARSEESLNEQFEKYKSVRPGTGEMGFGYLQPPRFKLEWLVIDRAAIERSVKGDPIESQKRFLASADSKEADQGKRRVAVEAIEATIRKELTDKVVQEATLAVKGEILRKTSRLAQLDGYRVLSDDWAAQMPRLAEVTKVVPAIVQDRTGTTLAEPSVFIREAAWLTVEDVNRLPGLGQARLRRGNQSVPVANLLSESKEARVTTGTPAVAVQARVPMTDSLEDQAGNRYFLTLLDARGEEVLAKIDEVREQVVIDRKKADAFETLKQQATTYRVVAAEQSLEELAQQLRTSLGIPVEEVNSIRVGRAIGLEPFNAKLADLKFVEAVVDYVASLDATKSIEETPAIDRILVVPIPSKQGMAIVRIDGYVPVSQERFRTGQVSRNAVGMVGRLQRDQITDNPFSAERLIKRLNVEFVGQKLKDKTEGDGTGGVGGADKPSN